MTAETPDIFAIVNRLEILERQNRRLKKAGLGILLLVLLLGFVTLVVSTRGSISAQEVHLTDGTGKFTAVLTADHLSFDDGDTTSWLTWDGLTLAESQRSKGKVAAADYPAGGIRTILDNSGLYLKYGPSGTKGSIEAALSLDKDGPNLLLKDRQGYMATIGIEDLVTTTTGETHKTSAASIVLSGKDKNVLWKAP